ncbi:Acad10 Acyl-CoA dehydrogenase family member 10 [Candida maltosa Xu316]|uniref:Phosphotransferase, putative n=1 Tax=Candida maltosa (strain Xu316) TaxID=1245528 RepID=M3JD21_CANMX|nr:Phosphotransferase, putative [Candida maltosa Xu316]
MSSQELLSSPELTDIRSPLDLDKFKKFLATVSPKSSKIHYGHNADIPKTFSNVRQFKFGQSNPTYLFVTPEGRKFVLRRKPSPNSELISKSAHAVEREFHILNSINVLNSGSKYKVPVPKVHLLCEDESAVGYVFYLMDYVNGIQIKNPDMPGFSQEDKKLYWKSIIETFAAIHLLDVEKLISLLPKEHFPQFQNIEKLKNTSYFVRQVKTLNNIHKLQSKHVPEIPHFNKLTSWLLEHAPQDPDKLTLIHGDLKIDNVLFDAKTKTVIGVLDWELTTIGNPLFDLANFLQGFSLPNKLNRLIYQPQETDIGLENKASQKFVYDRLQDYQRLVTWSKDPKNNPVDYWPVGVLFGLLRLCVISQGIAMRVVLGNASSAQASSFASMYPVLSDLALDVINSSRKLQSSL